MEVEEYWGFRSQSRFDLDSIGIKIWEKIKNESGKIIEI
jgi:hypothetical protein